jgi:filamentous hemagglutinin family protein
MIAPARHHLSVSSHTPRAMRPLVLALVAIWPLHSLQAQPVAGVRPPVPALNAVPVPALKWQQSRDTYEDGTRSSLTERANARGGVDQIIEQRLAREIYQWQRFDIGAASKVEFMLPSGGAALNRVDKGAAPSAIFGTLTSTVPNPNTAAGQPARIVGGDVYLLNANGILFGSGAQVNVGALVASTLNVENEDFLNGLTRSINGAQRSFWRDPLGLPATQEGSGFVEVQPGAEIRTPNGGRVFLFAQEVKQAGRIETPGGQTVLAAGSEVYLQAPTAEKLYAAEHNAAVPALRGLLVEVGGEAGRVDQLGEILSARGNTTLVGMAVNQMGRISASTSVSENGSVFLLARGKASASSGGAAVTKRASEGGSLVLGSSSRIEIAPEASTATSSDSAGFTPSRIEMSARSISLQGSEAGSGSTTGSGSGPGASIVAPGASVRLRAETVPVYEVPDTPGSHALSLPKPETPRFDATASLSLGRGVNIDLSGTRDTEVSAGRHYVTTELLGANDLKDAPLQKEGLLYRAKVTLDIRKDSKILGSLQSYRDAVERSVQERLSGGGSLMLESAGLVQADAGSRLDLSGGRIRYTASITQPSQLRGADGQLYELNEAPADQAYVGLSNAVYRHFGRWGAARSFVLGPSLALSGYEEGQAAGSLRVAGSQLRLDGEMLARTLVGERQREGLDKLAAPGRLQLGQASALATGVQQSLLLGSPAPAAGGTGSWLDLARLDASGFGRYALASDGDISVEQALRLAPRSQLSLFSRGTQGIRLAADVQSAGGTLSAQTVARPEQAGSQAGDIVVADGVRLDVAGRLVNQERDGVQPQASAEGGSLRLNSGAGLALGRDTVLDVSGGATVSGAGRVSAGAAGAIELRSSMVGDQAQRFDIEGARLLGLGLVRGGSLSLRAAEVQIGGSGSSLAEAGRLQLGTEFFSRGGFERLEIDGQRSLSLIAGSVLSPRLLNHGASDQQLRLDPSSGQARASGALLAELGATPRVQEDALRRPVHLSLLASGQAAVGGSGRLLVEEGARISLDPLASLNLRAAADLRVDGQLQTAGGQISLSQSGETAQQSQRLSLGRNAVIDVSGSVLPLPSSDGLLRGRVLDGGQVSLSALSLDWAQGTLIRADGASAVLDATSSRGPALPEGRQLLSSHAGRLSVDLFSNATQDSLLAGRFEARAGSAERAQGSFALSVGRRSETVALAHRLLLQSGQAQAQPLAGVRTVQLGTELFSAGLADLSLSSQDRLVLGGDLDLQLARRLLLDSPQLLLEGNGQARLSAASVALGSSSDARPGSSAPGRGTGRLTCSGISSWAAWPRLS